MRTSWIRSTAQPRTASVSVSRRTAMLSACALVALSSVSACTSTTQSTSSGSASQAESASTVRLPGLKVKVPTPFSYGGGVGYTQASYVYDTLMWKDTDGKEIPWLASSRNVNDDGTVHTYTLREGVTWSDGKPFTADDVAFTFTYLEKHRAKIAPSVISVVPPGLVTSVEAVDAKTVKFTLAKPDWTFARFTGAGGIFIFPKHIWESVDDPSTVTSTDALVGTGPYRITSMDAAAGAYRYEARDDFFGGTPAVRVIEHRPVGDQLAALMAGEVDQAGGVGPGTGLRPDVVSAFENKPDFEVQTAPVGQTMTALYFNLAQGGALADPEFRRAVARSINRQGLVDKALGGGGDVASFGLIPPGHPLHTNVEDYAFDRQRAEQDLEKAGYRRPDPNAPRQSKEGTPLEFELLVSQAQSRPIVDLVAADLKAIGINITVNVVDLPTFGKRRMAGDSQLSINTFGGTATDEQPDGMGKVYASSSRSLQSAQGYKSAEFDELYGKQRAELDDDARVTLAHDMQKLVATDVPLIPLVYPPLVTINRAKTVNNWQYTPGGVGGLVPSVNNKVAFIGGVPS